MTAHPMAPVIPSSGVLASWQRSRSAAARQLPLASPVPVPSLPEDVFYGIARPHRRLGPDLRGGRGTA